MKFVSVSLLLFSSHGCRFGVAISGLTGGEMLHEYHAFANMKDRTLTLIGLNRRSEYENKFILDTNLYIGIVYAFVVILVETYMICNNIMISGNPKIIARVGLPWLMQHRLAYIIQAASAGILIVSALLHRHRKPLPTWLAVTVLSQCLICSLLFGIYITFGDLERNNGMYVLLVQIVSITVLFFVRPVLTVPVTLVALQVTIWHANAIGTLSRGIVVNLYVFFLVIAVSTCVRYQFAIEVARNREMLDRESKLDALTNVGNVRAFNLDAQDYAGSMLTISMIDIDGFKDYNDSYGHSAGDELLILLASILHCVFADAAQCYRVGGDEFLIMSRILTPSLQNERLEQARAEFADATAVESAYNNGINMSFTWGTASGSSNNVNDVLKLRRQADDLMYQKKMNPNFHSCR